MATSERPDASGERECRCRSVYAKPGIKVKHDPPDLHARLAALEAENEKLRDETLEVAARAVGRVARAWRDGTRQPNYTTILACAGMLRRMKTDGDLDENGDFRVLSERP